MNSNNQYPIDNDDSLEVLLRAAQGGDDGAFSVLYARLNQQLYRFIYSRIRDKEQTKDILQDIFVDLWKGLRGFSYISDEKYYAFVFLITKR